VIIFLGITFWLGAKMGTQVMIIGSGYLLILHILTFRLIPIDRYIAQWLIRSATCYLCYQRTALDSFWRCGCGFQGYAPRSALSACPECGKLFKWVVCICGTTLPI